MARVLRQGGSTTVALGALLSACVHTTATTAPSTTSQKSGDSAEYSLNFVPFGAGQFQNGDTSKGVGFAVAEGTTAAASFAIWLYLTDYRGRPIPVEETVRVRRLQQLEVASGIAFFGIYALGVIDALVHYEPRVKVGATSVVVVPTPDANGAGLALSWTD